MQRKICRHARHPGYLDVRMVSLAAGRKDLTSSGGAPRLAPTRNHALLKGVSGMKLIDTGAVAFLFAAALAVGGPASAEEIQMNAELSGSEEVPPVQTSGEGEAD